MPKKLAPQMVTASDWQKEHHPNLLELLPLEFGDGQFDRFCAEFYHRINGEFPPHVPAGAYDDWVYSPDEHDTFLTTSLVEFLRRKVR